MTTKSTETIVIDCLNAILDQRGVARPPNLDRATVVFGGGGLLDSMGIVMLVVDLEQAVCTETGKAVTLADDRAMSQRSSPYRSVGALEDYIDAQLNGAA